MKFIITENKLDSIVDSYLTKQFENLKPVKVGTSTYFWCDSEKKPVIMITHNKKFSTIFVLDTVYVSTHDMFSMNGFKDIQYHLLKWFDEHMGIKSEEVFTFDNEDIGDVLI